MAIPAPENKAELLELATVARNKAQELMGAIGRLPDSYKRTSAFGAAEDARNWLTNAMDDFRE